MSQSSSQLSSGVAASAAIKPPSIDDIGIDGCGWVLQNPTISKKIERKNQAGQVYAYQLHCSAMGFSGVVSVTETEFSDVKEGDRPGRLDGLFLSDGSRTVYQLSHTVKGPAPAFPVGFGGTGWVLSKVIIVEPREMRTKDQSRVWGYTATIAAQGFSSAVTVTKDQFVQLRAMDEFSRVHGYFQLENGQMLLKVRQLIK